MSKEATSAGPIPRPRYNQPAPNPRRVIVRVLQQRCPVCEGRRQLPLDFYTYGSGLPGFQPCEQCGGKGVVAYTETETITDGN